MHNSWMIFRVSIFPRNRTFTELSEMKTPTSLASELSYPSTPDWAPGGLHQGKAKPGFRNSLLWQDTNSLQYFIQFMVSIATIMITISTSINHPSSRVNHIIQLLAPCSSCSYGNPPLKSTAIITCVKEMKLRASRMEETVKSSLTTEFFQQIGDFLSREIQQKSHHSCVRFQTKNDKMRCFIGMLAEEKLNNMSQAEVAWAFKKRECGYHAATLPILESMRLPSRKIPKKTSGIANNNTSDSQAFPIRHTSFPDTT